MLNYTDSDMSVLQKLQNRAMRIILKVNRYTEIRLMLSTLGWMSVKQKMMYDTLILVLKMRNGLMPHCLTELITLNQDKHTYNTREQKRDQY